MLFSHSLSSGVFSSFSRTCGMIKILLHGIFCRVLHLRPLSVWHFSWYPHLNQSAPIISSDLRVQASEAESLQLVFSSHRSGCGILEVRAPSRAFSCWRQP